MDRCLYIPMQDRSDWPALVARVVPLLQAAVDASPGRAPVSPSFYTALQACWSLARRHCLLLRAVRLSDMGKCQHMGACIQAPPCAGLNSSGRVAHTWALSN